MKSIVPVVVLLQVVYLSLFNCTNAIKVTIDHGKLFGTKLISRNGNPFYAFYSIPYAKPPVGKLRFQPPQEAGKWIDVRNATEYSPVCIQKNYYSKRHDPILIGQEDCLYLNIFTQQFNGTAPVLVFIHGGGYITGTSYVHRANYLMDQGGIVFVTFNYRLGILGFLNSGDESLAGNNGMKDQVMALKWVKKNIASFGGDPLNILIFGHSAGAGSVHLHMFSPLSQGLFNKAVSLSGTTLGPWGVHSLHTVKECFRTVSLLSGCSYKTTWDAVECLKEVPASDIIEVQGKLFAWQYEAACPLGPSIESEKVAEPFLTRKPHKGKELYPEIPWIVGQTSAEGIFKVDNYLEKNGTLLKYLNDNYRRLLPIITLYKSSLDQLSKSSVLADDLKRIYFQGRDISLETLKSLVDLVSDTFMTFATAESVLGYKGSRYLYYFDYKSGGDGGKQPYDPRLTSLGVCHSEDLGYLFDEYVNLIRNETITDVADLKMSENWIKILVNFAYTGDPNTNSIENFQWDTVMKEDLQPYLNVNNDGFQMETKFFKEKYEIWKKHLSKYFK